MRRPGLGIFIEGSESSKRQAISAVICEQLGEHHLLGMLRGEGQPGLPPRSQFIDGVDADVIEHVEEALEDCEEQLGIRFSDSGFISLFVYISLAVQRLRAGESITIEPEQLQKLRILPEYVVAKRMADRLRQSLHLNIPADEAGFIAMHLTGARIWPGSQTDLTQTRAINVCQTVLAIMEVVGEELDTDFRGDDGLLDDLSSHIPPIGRLRVGMPIENPQLDSLLTDYPEVYHACEKGADVLRELLGTETIPPSEIGFLAMHFGAALERKRNQLRHIAAGLQRKYPNLDVRGVMSAFQLDPDKLRAEGVELVVSTVELDIKFRYLRVNPMLTMQDKMLLGTAIDALLLHGRTALTEHSCFDYVRLDPPFYEKGRVMLGAVIMLIPDGVHSEACACIMSEISGLLLENRVLLDAMRAENTDGLRGPLEGLLLRFYKRTTASQLSLSRKPV